MCTFTQGLVDQGKREGIAKEKKATIIRMINFGLADKDISTLSAVPLSTIQKIKKQLTSNADKPDKINSF